MIFLGCLFDKNREKEYLQKSTGGLSNAVNTFQWNCLEGFYQNAQDVKIFNVLPVGTFPFAYRDLVLPDKEWEYFNTTHREVGCLNLPYIKQWQRSRKIKKLLKKEKDKKIIIYSAYLPFLRATYKLGKEYDITLIVTDMPEFYDLGKVGKLRKILRKISNKLVYKYMKRVNRFVLLTEQMKKPLQVGERPYTIVEGICSKNFIIPFNIDETKEKIILYTGTLHRQFGIETLVKAFMQISNENYRLWICGSGDYQKEIEDAAKQDKRICFYGYVSKDDAIKYQAQATVLVNPRQNVGEYTKYSFPSKTMEYLLSGKPVVAYKLDGIPDEYDPYINYVVSNTEEALAEKLIEACEDAGGVMAEKARRAQAFVITQKSAKAQANKILSLLKR